MKNKLDTDIRTGTKLAINVGGNMSMRVQIVKRHFNEHWCSTTINAFCCCLEKESVCSNEDTEYGQKERQMLVLGV
jgi:hypothetical protein